ncbi:hypothetical protein Y1Q_0003845 [Alligator mississippiensis]|nr:hypothetical protein Y1Q_0003845 [Alligator mississippiensis]
MFAIIYKRIAQLKSNHSDDILDGPRKALSYFWDLYGKIWHGYELHGLENIPEGPCLIIFYHGAISIDHLIFVARYFILTHRMCVSVIDRFFVKLPGLKSLLETFSATSGTKEECLNALKNGQVVAVSPGGAREAYFSDETYKLIWGNRKGFAQLAIDAKVPIIPMYTENIREAYMMPKERRLIRWLYETSRLPIISPHGGFPVKLCAHVGEPIPYDPNITAEELAEKEAGEGYELHGLENIPEGPALLILYHGAVSIDHIIFVARFFILTHRMCVSVAHRYFFKIPGLQSILEVFSVIPGTKEECLDALKKGQVVAIAPGGAREALFSDDTYKLIWVHHKGFAQLAIDAKVPIIPMYTENVREAYRMPKERKLTRWLYETLGLSVTAPCGGLPVKLRTHIGEPIPYDPNTTAEELAEKTKTALQNLIQSHQQIPGSIWKALLARFDKPQKDD